MTGIASSANKLSSERCVSVKNIENVIESESENESNTSIRSDNAAWQNINTHQDKIKKCINEPNLCQLGINNDSGPYIQNITVQESSNPMFGNKTICNAPVTINQISKWQCTRRNVICFLIVTTLIIVVTLILTLFLLKNGVGSGGEADNSPLEWRLISRDEWKAGPPKNITYLELPSNRVIIAHTVTGNCIEVSDCASQLRSIQKYHMKNIGCDDIGYNFVIGGDGGVFVGRGWDIRGEHTYGFNAKSIGIAFIGDYTMRIPTRQQLYAAQQIIEEGVKLKKLSYDYRLYGQRQLQNTISPGDALYKVIMKWSHWSPHVEQ